MSAEAPQLDPVAQHPHLEEYPDAVQNKDLAHRLAHIEKPYHDMAAQSLTLGRQAVEHAQAAFTDAQPEEIDSTSMITEADFKKFGEQNGYNTRAVTRAWGSLAIDGGKAFELPQDNSQLRISFPVKEVFSKLNGLIPDNATPAEKIHRVNSLRIAGFGPTAYDLVLAYCQTKIEEEQSSKS